MLEQGVISQPNPVPRDDHYLLPPPTTRDEYEAAAQIDRNKSNSNVSYSIVLLFPHFPCI